MFEVGEAVLSLHVLEHAVRATLHWHVEEGVDSGVCQDLPNFLRCEGVCSAVTVLMREALDL